MAKEICRTSKVVVHAASYIQDFPCEELYSNFQKAIPLIANIKALLPITINLDESASDSSAFIESDKPFKIVLSSKGVDIHDLVSAVFIHELGHLVFHSKNETVDFSSYYLAKISPYDEFFADLLAVLTLKDGTAMRRALMPMSAVPSQALSRD